MGQIGNVSPWLLPHLRDRAVVNEAVPQWNGRRNIHRPDYLHFDRDPVEGFISACVGDGFGIT